MLGLFEGVKQLSKAARAIDAGVDGALTDIMQRRMFLGRVGEVFILPAVRHDIRTDLVICAGMGRLHDFDAGVLQTVAENVARTMVRAKVDDFAMVFFNATRGNLHAGLRNLVDGFFRGVRGAQGRNPLRALTICEIERARCDEIEAALAKLYRTRRAERVEVTLEKITEETRGGRGQTKFRASVLASGAQATTLSETISIDTERLEHGLTNAHGGFRRYLHDALARPPRHSS